MREKLRLGVTAEEQETIEELLASAQVRILAEIPDEAQAILGTLSPTLLEAYALLKQPVEVLQRREQEMESAEVSAPGAPSQPAPRMYHTAVAPRPNTLTLEDDDDEVSVTLTASNAAEQAFVDALSGLHAQAGGQVAHGQSLRVVPSVTPAMTLDPFQHAYHGLVEIQSGSKKKPRTEFRTMGVLQEIFEAEEKHVGVQVRQPAYWLPKLNWMSVYLVDELQDQLEVGWLLGDYDARRTGIPAGVTIPPEQIAAYLSDGRDDEEWTIKVIKKYLRTAEQKAWLDAHDYSIEDALSGRTYGEQEIDEMYADWNAKLGVKAFGF